MEISFTCWAPCQEATFVVIPRSIAAKEIDSPGVPCCNRFEAKTGNRNPQLAAPHLAFNIYAGRMKKAGIPASIVEGLTIEINFQINPLVIGCNLKFPVVAHSLRVRIDKDFGDVSPPEFPSFLKRILIVVDVQRLIRAAESEVDRRRAPDGTYLRPDLWVTNLGEVRCIERNS